MVKPISYPGSEPYIFISYAHDDEFRVYPLIQGLQDRGFRVWYDGGIKHGADWRNFIATRIQNCRVFLIFISRRSMASQYCQDELDYAHKNRRDLLAVELEAANKLPGVEMTVDGKHGFPRGSYRSDRELLELLDRADILQVCRGSSQKVQEPQYRPGLRTRWEQLHQDARVGQARAQYELGCDHFSARDYQNALLWLGKAAEAGYAPAQVKLGLCCERGYGLERPDLVQAWKWYSLAAEKQDPEGLYSQGLWYEEGKFVGRDLLKAMECYTRASALGHVNAAAGIARCKQKLNR